MAFSRRWKDTLRKHMGAVPKGSSFGQYKEAVRLASREYRAARSNPDGKGLVKLALLAGAAYVGWRVLMGPKAGQA